MRRGLELVLPVLVLLSFATPAVASVTNGTVNDSRYAWGENIGWINFAPSDGSSYAGLVITDSAVTGYAWSNEFGWINFAPTSSGQGVSNTTSGALSGKAWSAALGWIDFTGVTINSSGVFTGVAGSSDAVSGRISFDCNHCHVATDWRPLSARETEQNQNPNVPAAVPPTVNPPVQAPIAKDADGNLWPTITPRDPVATNVIPVKKVTDSKDPIKDFYQKIGLAEPERTQSSEYVESFNMPLIIARSQKGLAIHDSGKGTGAAVEIPLAVSGEDQLTLTIDEKQQQTTTFRLAQRNVVAGSIFTITARTAAGVPVHTFTMPLKITLAVPEDLQGTAVGVYYREQDSDPWQPITNVAYAGKTVTFFVDHLTQFAILSHNSFSEGAGIPAARILAGSMAALAIILFWKRRKKQSSPVFK